MDGFLCHLAAVFFSDLNMATSDFWERLACCIHDYQADFPELAGEFNRYDLFAERFAHSCLNRLQLANNQHMLNLEAPAESLQYAGFLANPLAPFKHRRST
jgi:siderophore synthetase component